MNRILSFIAASFLVLGIAGPARALDIERVVSPGGIEAWLVEEHQVPVVVMKAAWIGGAAYDPRDRQGLANMVSGLLDEGAGDMDSQTYQKTLDDNAVRLGFDAGRDTFSTTLKTLDDRRDEAFRLFALAVSKPRFDEQAVERIRAQILTGLSQKKEDPNWLAGRAWFESAFGDHPYARPSNGTPESVQAITREDLNGFAKRVLARDNLKIAVVGPITPEELGPLLDKAFGDLPEKADLPSLPDMTIATRKKPIIVEKPFPQSVVLFGTPGIKREDPDFIPAYVMNYVLGGGSFSSRLVEEVRVKHGLVYSIGTSLYPLDHSGFFFGQFGTKNKTVGVALKIVREQLERMAKSGVTAEELKDAKTYLTGSYPLGFDSNGSIASRLLGIQLENLGIDYVEKRNGLVEAVTREDVQRAAKRILGSGKWLVAVVGQPDLSEDVPAEGDLKPDGEAPRHGDTGGLD
ncbi:zinc protease [Parvibaculum indicum]|uniref:insulinase family protein n=1 Tax=Parvibaculum indicum TaxID=562969 RepID=UPI0014231263|nr:zinc protease [Parvibaculum indicum]